MGINSINSYGMNFYNYQSSINNIRLSQAVSKNPKFSQLGVPAVSYGTNPLKSSMNFVKEYTSSMSALLGAASDLKAGSSQSVMKDMSVTSSDESVASAAAKFSVRDAKEITLDVKQLAAAQSNASSSVKASDTALSDMNFTVNSGKGPVSVAVSSKTENGTAKTNVQMLREAADQINRSKTAGVTANLVQKDGNVSLELTANETGTGSSFSVSGELGAAAGLDRVKTEAADAKYSVTENGKTMNYTSSKNDVSVDFTRIGVTLKGVGEAVIRSDVDSKKVSSALGNLVDKYNSSLKLLNDNYERGTGVERQLRNLVTGLGSEESLKKLGITVNKDATLSFDKDVFAENMKKDPDLTRQLISGTGGLADKAFSKAMSGINVNSNSLINGDVESLQTESLSNPFTMFGMYSKSGAYTMNNYAAVGMMMNYLI